MNEETRKRLANKSGDNNSQKAPKYTVPLIRFNGNTGAFRKVSKNEDNEDVETNIVAPVEFVILKKRRTLSSFSANQSFFTNEHNTSAEKVMLFKVIDKTVTFEDIGFAADIREKYQALRTHEVVYVLFNGEICKMEIKGGSLSGYYEYQKKLSEEELHSFEVTTVINSEKTKSDAGFGYYKMTFDFKRDDSLDFDLIEKSIDEVSKACQDSDAYTKQKIAEKSGNKTGGNAGNLSIENDKADKVFDSIGKDADDINASDIPF